MEKEIKVGDYLKHAYSLFGRSINTERATAQLMDGCKPVIRRVLYSSYELGNKFSKSATVTGKTIGNYHPHGEASVYPTIVGLVRAGIMTGQGQFGGRGMLPDGDTGAAAQRYTEVKLKDSFFEFINMLIKHVPYVESEIAGYTLPEYLPTPLPIALLTGTFGIGFGMNTSMPAFTPKSLLNAYLHDDPSLLKLPYKLLIDHENSEFDKLWTEGSGNIIMAFSVKQGYSLDGVTYGTVITGDPDIFRPTITEELSDMIDQGKALMRDESGPEGNRLFIAREKRVSVISDDWIYEQCKLGAIKSINYRINVAHEGKVGAIGIKDWVHITYTNYLKIMKCYFDDHIKDIEWKLLLLKYADQVMDEFQKSNLTAANSDMASTLGIDEEIVADIMKSSLSSWRRMDKEKREKDLNDKLKYWKSLVPENVVIDLINKL